ncbi:MAG: hypothetical protein LH473_07535 [Chitinophagales bacterium]|nr:hypothetical protein [Chitinophagales bacterium]
MLLPLSSFNNYYSPTCTGCGGYAIITADAVSTSYEFRCGGGTNCLLGTITTTSTNKKIVCCDQTTTCITLASTDGASCLKFTKGEGYYAKKSGTTGPYIYFIFRNQSSVACAQVFTQDGSDQWSRSSSHHVPFSSDTFNITVLPKCLQFQTCTECN